MVVVAAAVALAVAVAAAAVEDGGGDIVARRGGVVVVVVVLSVVSNSPKKEMLESLLYSLLSLRQKRKTALSRVCFLRIPFVLLSPRGGGISPFWFLFNRTRSARAAGRVLQNDGLSFFENEFFVLFRVCIKKIREKNCLTLSSHAHSPARAQRERQTERKKGRRETENRRSHTHRALFAFLFRDYIPFLLEWVIHTALVHS